MMISKKNILLVGCLKNVWFIVISQFICYLCIIHDTLIHILPMKRLYDKYTIYQFSDESIITEICKRIKMIRFSCSFSQQEFADKAGVSIITIKRIKSSKVNDITLSTLLKILRASWTLEGVMDWVPELPESPFLILHDNQ